MDNPFQLKVSFGQVEWVTHMALQYTDSLWNFKMVQLGVNWLILCTKQLTLRRGLSTTSTSSSQVSYAACAIDEARNGLWVLMCRGVLAAG